MEIVVRGRNVEVPEHYRTHVEDKVGQLERFDGKLKLLRLDVELYHEKNPRQSANCQRVEITARGKGPVIRAESAAPDFYAALDLACQKLDARLRKAADRRRVHHGRRTPDSVRLSAGLPEVAAETPAPSLDGAEREPQVPEVEVEVEEHLPGRIVREKHHPAVPMHVDQALHEMELVGHDFYLFLCADTGQPTVVYRRHAFDYGLIRLSEVPQNGVDTSAAASREPAPSSAAAPAPAPAAV